MDPLRPECLQATLTRCRCCLDLATNNRYDCEPPAGTCDQLFNRSTGLMQLYDVGFTSHFVAEAEALAKLAAIAGKPSCVCSPPVVPVVAGMILFTPDIRGSLFLP
jgi:hypothetical protein